MKAKLTSPTLAAACLALLCATSVSLRAGTVTVTNTADSGPGTLREALGSATNGDIIDATGVSGTITLDTGQLNVTNSVTIMGAGPGLLAVSGNQAYTVFNVTGSNVTISGLTIASGSGTNGAGVYSGGSILTVSNCTISQNNAGTGGGIYNHNTTLKIDTCAFSGNTAFFGGGIGNEGSGGIATMIINASTFSSNSAGYSGGGIYNHGGFDNAFSTNDAVLSINACTFSANSAPLQGGAIENQDAVLKINACTFHGNSGVSSSIGNDGFFNSSPVELGDTILDAGASGINIHNSPGTIISDGYNLCSDNGGGFLTATGDQTNTNPMLGPLQNNGGPTLTHALLTGSPAIDKGKRDAVASLGSHTDQRGLPRSVDNPSLPNAPGGDGSDIGAYEEQFSALTLRVENMAGQPGQKNLIYTPWATGWSYTLQSTTNLSGTAFAPLDEFAGPTTNGAEVICTDPNATGPQKFYRLKISLP